MEIDIGVLSPIVAAGPTAHGALYLSQHELKCSNS